MTERKRGVRNDWRGRTQCISWSTDEEKMVRYAMQKLWPVPFVGVRNDTGRSLYVHSATAFFFMFLQWAMENNIDVPVKFFEDLYGLNFDAVDKLSRLKHIYREVVLNDKIKNASERSDHRERVAGSDSGVVPPRPDVDNQGHEREPQDGETTHGDDGPANPLP